jgi:hypothetical protein
MKNPKRRSLKYFVYLLIVSIALTACGGNRDSLPNATVTVNDEGGKDAGLDLQALGELVKKSSNPADLEKALNQPGSINNLDLDTDGKVDFVKVTELSKSDNTKALKFTDITTKGDSSDIAEVDVNKGTNNQASMDVVGSPAVYQSAPSYHSDFSVGEVLLMAYLFSPHPYYYSPYRYGYYPSYYRSYQPVPMVSYHRTVNTYNSHPVGHVTNTSPRSNRTDISSSNHSQKSFSTRSSSKPVGSGGFGSHSSSSSSSSYHSSSPSYHSSSSSSSSRRSFGSSRRH